MNKYLQHFINRVQLAKSTNNSLSLLLDSCRMKHADYLAKHKNGVILSLTGGNGEWFTFFENVVREDCLQGIPQLKEGDCVVDIGANIGTFTIVSAQRVGKSGRVYAFEPDKEIFARLQNNIKLNKLNNVTAINAAVGKENGIMKFYKHSKNAYSSLVSSVDGRNDSHVSSSVVEVVGIEKMIQDVGKINLLKVDCEGGEYDIFDALDYDLASNISSISMEIHEIESHSPGKLKESIRSLGFDICNKYPFTATRN